MLLVIEKLIDKAMVADLRAQLSGANWSDGAATAGTRSVAVKQNLQLGHLDAVGKALGEDILRALGQNPMFISATLAERIFPPVFNLYQDGGHYGTHVDGSLMRVPGADLTIRSDVSGTLFLSEPDEYDGGELIIEGQYGGQAVKLAAGDMVIYPSNSLHQVTPVTRGQRLCAITWIQSAIADTAAREMLFDLDQSIQSLSVERSKTDPDVDRLIHVYHNLVRRWAKV